MIQTSRAVFVLFCVASFLFLGFHLFFSLVFCMMVFTEPPERRFSMV